MSPYKGFSSYQIVVYIQKSVEIISGVMNFHKVNTLSNQHPDQETEYHQNLRPLKIPF